MTGLTTSLLMQGKIGVCRFLDSECSDIFFDSLGNFDDVSFGEPAYVPWHGRVVDRLTMRLDCLAREAATNQGRHEDELYYDNV